MKYKYRKLRGRIMEHFDTHKEFAEAVGITQNTLYRKLSGNLGISQKDVEKWSTILEIPRDEYGEFYYT